MAMNFKKAAAKVGAIDGPATANRDGAKLEAISGEILTVHAFYPLTFTDKKSGEQVTRAVVHFDEYPKHFFFWSGVLLDRALFAWAEECGCHADDNEDFPYADFDALNAELGGGNLKVRITKGTNSRGNPLTRLEIIDG